MTVTYVPIVGANMINTIVNGGATAVAKSNASLGAGRPSRTRLILRLDDIDATSTANDRVVTMTLDAPPAMNLTGGLGAAYEDQYLPLYTITPADAATQAAVGTVRPFLAITAINTTTRVMTAVFTTITGADNLSFYIGIDFSHSIC